MAVRVRGGRFMLDIRHHHGDGRVERIRIAVPKDKQSRRAAEAYQRTVLADLRAGIDPRASRERSSERAAAPSFASFAGDYLATITNLKPSSLDSKASILRHHLLPFFGSMLIDRIGPKEIELFKASRLRPTRGRALSNKTVNNMLTVLRRILSVASDWGVIPSTPRVAWLKVPPRRFRFLDFHEAERLVDASIREPLAHAMIVVALNTGLRLGELLALRWDAVDLKAGRIHVREAVARGIIGTPKSGRAREVPLNNTVIAALRGWKHLRGPLVFCTDDGRMMTKNEAKAPLRRARLKAGITELGWHDMRHSFASHLVMRGVPLKAVQELLGHATIEMTMRYAHLAPSVVRDAVCALDRGHGLGIAPNRESETAS